MACEYISLQNEPDLEVRSHSGCLTTIYGKHSTGSKSYDGWFESGVTKELGDMIVKHNGKIVLSFDGGGFGGGLDSER